MFRQLLLFIIAFYVVASSSTTPSYPLLACVVEKVNNPWDSTNEPSSPSNRPTTTNTPRVTVTGTSTARDSRSDEPPGSANTIPNAVVDPSWSANCKVWFPLLRLTIGHSGAAFVKWGQWASTRSDMFPEAFCRELSRLQSQAPTHSFSYTRQQVEHELGYPLCQIFDEFEKHPIASGSIAQVHRAVLAGQPVAVKVRHPFVVDQIRQDFLLMDSLVDLMEKIPYTRWMKLKESIAQFSDKIATQTSLDLEGRQLLQFNENFQDYHDIHFPSPIVMTDSVLVETYFSGESVSTFINEVEKDIEDNIDLAHYVVTRGEDVYMKMLVLDNFMHADLHPGNILLTYTDLLPTTEIKRFDKRHTIALVDAGMVAILTADQREHFIGLLEAIGEGDATFAVQCLLNFSSSPPHVEENNNNNNNTRSSIMVKELEEEMQRLFQEVARGYHTNVDIGLVLKGILSLVQHHHITIDANYATLVMNVLCLDSMAKALLPSYNVLDAAKPFLRLHRLSRLLPRRMRRILHTLLYPLASWMKKRQDREVLRRLRHLSLSDLHDIYHSSRQHLL
eukprot:gene1716-1875_t